MRKILSFALAAVLALGISVPAFAADAAAPGTDVTVTLDGAVLSFDVPPQIVNGRVLVPMRGIFEALGATVNWDGDRQTIVATKDDTTVIMQIDNPIMMVGERQVALDVPPQIIDDRTMVPARAAADALGASVSWNADTRTVIITSGGATAAQIPMLNNYAPGTLTAVGYASEYLDMRLPQLDGYTYAANQPIPGLNGMVNGFIIADGATSELNVNSDDNSVLLCVCVFAFPSVEVNIDDISGQISDATIGEIESIYPWLNVTSDYDPNLPTPTVKIAGKDYTSFVFTVSGNGVTFNYNTLLRINDDGSIIVIYGLYTPNHIDDYGALLDSFTEY